MRRLALGYRAGSTIISAGLLAAGSLLLAINDARPAAAQAAAEDVPAVEIPVRNRGRYTMPRGASVTAADLKRKLAALTLREQRRPQPKHAAELARLKNLPAPRNVPTRYVPEAQPRVLELTKSCFGGQGDGSDPSSNVSGAKGQSGMFVQATSLTVTSIDFSGNCADRSEQPLDDVLGVTGNEHAFEPHVHYDPATNRWFIGAAGFNFSNGNQSLLLAHSADGLDWTRLAIPLVENGTTSCLLDPFNGVFYPKVVIYPTGVPGEPRIVVAAVQEGVDKTAAVVTASVDGSPKAACPPTPDGMPPVQPVKYESFEAALAYTFLGFVPDIRVARAGARKIQRYELTLGSRPSRDRLRRKTPITVPAWKPPPDARQPNGQKLDTGDGGFTAPGVQIGDRIWIVHTVNDGGFARPEVYELSTTADTPVAVYRLSSVPEENDHLFNASIAVNGAGANGIAFVNATRTIRTGGPTGRAAMVVLSGPHASATGWESVVVKTSPGQFSNVGVGNSCNNTAQGGCNWGAYSSIQIDPLSKNRAWATNQLATKGTINGAGSDFNWSTVIGGVKR